MLFVSFLVCWRGGVRLYVGYVYKKTSSKLIEEVCSSGNWHSFNLTDFYTRDKKCKEKHLDGSIMTNCNWKHSLHSCQNGSS